MSDNADSNNNIYTDLNVLMQFIYTNKDKLSEIYEIEHNTTGLDNPINFGNPGALVVTRKTDNQVDIFYYHWSAMEQNLQSSVLDASSKSPNQFHLILIDKIVNKSVMVGMDKTIINTKLEEPQSNNDEPEQQNI